MPNFLDIKNLHANQIIDIINTAQKWKIDKPPNFLDNKNIMMIFEKPSLRTKVSFEVCIKQLGGNISILNSSDFLLGERESIFDTAKVLERYVDMIIIRSFEHSILKDFSSVINIPIINALTNFSHPCQVIGDLLTLKEHVKNFNNKKIAWFGDCNNVTQSWIEAAVLLGINFYIACPKDVSPNQQTLEWIRNNKGNIIISQDINLVAHQADCIMTDTWVSMGDKKDKSLQKFLPFQVNEKIMKMAKPHVLFMHCLPAYRGYEVVEKVINGNNSIIYDQAENRLHAQKSIINYCFS